MKILTGKILLLFLILLVQGCDNKKSSHEDSDSLIVINGRYKILDCPNIVQDNPSTCGVFAALAVLEYYGKDEYADKLAKLMNTSYETGTEMEEIVRVMKSYGLNAEMKQMNIDELKKCINDSIPVIIMLQAYNPSGNYKDDGSLKSAEWGHYVTVIGYGEGKIVFADPSSYPKTFLSEEELNIRWKGIDEYRGRKPQLLENYGIIVTDGKSDYKNKMNIMHKMK
jgi:uncharacterized protein YvpB